MRYDWRRRQAEQQQAERDRRATWRLCLHESAHAAVCLALGVPFDRVAVWFDDTLRQRGVVELEDGGSADQQSLLVVHLAGPASDMFFYGRDLDLYGSDNRNAISVADDIARVEGGDWYAIIQHGRRRAEELVRQHAEAIKALARELLAAREHELPGQECVRILAREGVERVPTPRKPPTVSTPGRVPMGTTMRFERRGGVDRPVARPEPGRESYDVRYRTDGWIG
jgi:hypothetical protein